MFDWSFSLLCFPRMKCSKIKFGWISIFKSIRLRLFFYFFIRASWLEAIVQVSLVEWRRSNSAAVFSIEYILAVDIRERVGKLFCRWNGQMKGDRKQKIISPANIILLEHYGIGLLSDMNSLLPLHWLSPQEEGSQLQLQPLSHYADDFPAEKLHAWCPSIQRGLQFEYMFFFSPLPPTSSLHTSEKKVYFWCIALVFILPWWGNRERALTQSIYTTPLKSTPFSFGEEWNCTNVWGIPAVKSKLLSYSHGLFRVTTLPFQMHTSGQGI